LEFFFRYFADGIVDPIAIVAGIVQTGLYVDFFYVYVTKYGSLIRSFPDVILTGPL
jgi:hypothetical protein